MIDKTSSLINTFNCIFMQKKCNIDKMLDLGTSDCREFYITREMLSIIYTMIDVYKESDIALYLYTVDNDLRWQGLIECYIEDKKCYKHILIKEIHTHKKDVLLPINHAYIYEIVDKNKKIGYEDIETGDICFINKPNKHYNVSKKWHLDVVSIINLDM